jgi:hypothetical protein
MKWLKKIGRGFSTLLLGFLLIMIIIMVVFLADARATIMNADWVKDEMDKGGFYPAIRQELADELKDSLTGDLDQEEAQRISDAVDAAITDEWAKANFESNADVAYAFFKSESDDLGLSITLPDTLKERIKDVIADIFTEESTDLTPSQINAGLAAVNKQVDNLPDELALQVENAEVLQPVRDAVKIYDYAFYILIAFAVLLAILLILLHFTVKDAIRVLGFFLLIGSAICWGAAFALNKMAPSLVDEGDFSTNITKDMVIKVIRDSVSPANLYSIAIMVVAAVLIVASFFIKRKAKT